MSAARRHRAWWTLAVLSGATAYGGDGAAQRRRDAGAEAAVDAGPDPSARVQSVMGDATAVVSRGGRTRSSSEWTIPVALRRGGCYRVLGAADGETQTHAEVTVRAASVLSPLALAHSEGRVAEGRFCIEEAPELYRLAVRAEGPAAWHVAVVEATPAAPRAVQAATVDAGAPADNVVSTTEYEIGGGANDYVGAQLRAYAAARPGRVGFTPVVREVLPTHAQHSRTVVLPAGRCIESVAAGVPSVADLELLIEDPNGNRVAQDGTRRGTEGVRFCPVFSGTYTLRVRVRMGAGLVAMQCLIER